MKSKSIPSWLIATLRLVAAYVAMSQEAQINLSETLGEMIEALDNGTALDPKQFEEAEEKIKELEVWANGLRQDLKKLHKQELECHN